jgi:hypothetical protein
MSYVGWKDIKSALRYVDPTTSFGGLALKPALNQALQPAALTQV